MRLPAFFLWSLMSLTAFSQPTKTFKYDASCQTAYQSIFKLKFQEARQQLANVRQVQPDNLMVDFLGNYMDFLALYISEDQKLFEKLAANKDTRIAKMQTGPQNSPYYLYTQANLHLQWAFTRIKFGEYLTAVMEVRKAHQLLTENKEKFPSFKPNDKDLALLNTLFGAIPDKYKFGAKLLGLNGNIEKGLADMGNIIRDEQMTFREEAVIMYTMMLLHLGKNKEGAWKIIDDIKLPLGDNLLNHFIVASVASYTGKNDKVISVLSQRPTGAVYYPFPFLDYMLGNAKLNRLDKDADVYYNRFLQQFKGINYIRDANRKLGWHYLLINRPEQYYIQMQKVTLSGGTDVDADKAALTEAKKKQLPNVPLLQARLLNDGGYLQRALDMLEKVDPEKLKRGDTELEYYYRKARILDDMGQTAKAIPLYEITISKGDLYPLYYAPNSCIKLGFIYEKQGNKVKASYYYNKALTYTKHEYKNSIDTEAKAGLNRISVN